MSDTDTIRLPFLDLSDIEAELSLFMATDEQKLRVLRRVFTNEGHTLDEVPEVWAAEPLRTWCWLVLTVNGIEFDPLVHHSMAHFGIDFGFSETPVRQWIWFLA